MKTYPVNLQLHLMQECATLATCVLVTRTDARVFAFTTHDRPLTIGGVDYLPAASFNPTDIAQGNNLDSDDNSIEGLLASDTITEDDIRAGRWNYFTWRRFQVNWNDLTFGQKKDGTGKAGEITCGRSTFIAELLGLISGYQTSIGDLTSSMCRYSLGDANCTYVFQPGDLVTGTIVTADSDFFTLHDAARTEANGFFDEGVIQFTGPGGNPLIGFRYEVKAYLVGLWVTKTSIAYDATGAQYQMTRGCNRLFATCVGSFANGINFGGEPWLQGADKMLQFARTPTA